MTKTEEIRAQIQDCLHEGVEAMLQILRNPNSSAGARIKAFEALADRGGLPSIKASVTQNMNSSLSVKEIADTRKALLQEQKQLMTEMDQLRTKMSGKNSEVVTDARKALQILPYPRFEERNSS